VTCPPTAPYTDRPDATAEFAQIRPRLLGIAERILTNRSEGEDIVQDAWIRWQGCDRDAVTDPTGFLVTMTTRLSINAVTSARVRREACLGERLPEPVDNADDPSLGPERREDLELGIRVLLERLAPVECAAFVLRKAFDYPYAHIASVLRISEVNARQVVSRAGRHLSAGSHRPAGRPEPGRLVNVVAAAARLGEMGPLEDLLASAAA